MPGCRSCQFTIHFPESRSQYIQSKQTDPASATPVAGLGPVLNIHTTESPPVNRGLRIDNTSRETETVRIASSPSPPDRPSSDTCPIWRRLTARAFDLTATFFLLLALVVSQILWFMDDISDSIAPEPWGNGFAATVAFLFLHLVYEVSFHTWGGGQTPGKLLTRCKVVTLANGASPGPFRSSLRWLLPGLPFPLLFTTIPWLGFMLLVGTGIPAVFDRRRRRSIHDMLAATIVITHAPTDAERKDSESLRESKAVHFKNLLDFPGRHRFGA